MRIRVLSLSLFKNKHSFEIRKTTNIMTLCQIFVISNLFYINISCLEVLKNSIYFFFVPVIIIVADVFHS